jgi:glycosyltransferase involved in cell wall biosynthesis/uncharacterized protein (DUF2062 family)
MAIAESPDEQHTWHSTQQIAVVIPVYNQPSRLKEMVLRCAEVCSKVLVLDDGSVEEVAPSLSFMQAEVLRHPVNKGKGAAIKTAAQHLLKQGITHIITIDADGQHYPEDIPRFIEAIREHPEDLIIGVRDFNDESVPGSSRFGRAFGNFWVKIQTGTEIHDIQSGFRAYPLAIFKHLSCWSKGYAFEVEAVVRALWGGVKVHEINIRVHYPKSQQQNSHFNKLRDNARLALLNTHLTIRSFMPWPHRPLIGSGAAAPVTIWHPLRSIKMLLMERATPKELAFATGLGVFIGATPLIGCHTLIILMSAAWLRLNRIAAVAASQICMPPLVPALCIEIGYYIRYGRFLTLESINSLHDVTFIEVGYMGLQRVWDWLIGSLIVGPILALLFGVITYIIAQLLRRIGRAF